MLPQRPAALSRSGTRDMVALLVACTSAKRPRLRDDVNPLPTIRYAAGREKVRTGPSFSPKCDKTAEKWKGRRIRRLRRRGSTPVGPRHRKRRNEGLLDVWM